MPVRLHKVVTFNSILDTSLIVGIFKLCTGVVLSVAVATLSRVKAPLMMPLAPVLPKKNR